MSDEECIGKLKHILKILDNIDKMLDELEIKHLEASKK